MTIHSIPSLDQAAALRPTLAAGERVSTLSYYPPVFPATTFLGGRVYVWCPDRPVADHDGGTVVSLTVPWDGTRATLESFLAGTGETNPGGTGCLVLQHPGEVFVEDYGAIGDDSTDDYPSIIRAVNRPLRTESAKNIRAGVVKLRDTKYMVLQTINLKATVTLVGTGQATLVFPTNVAGIIANRDDTYGYGVVPESGDSGGSVLKDFRLMGIYGDDVTKHGLWMRRAIRVENVEATRFAGNGINIEATAITDDVSRRGNANGWVLLNVRCSLNKRHGVYVDGADVNAGFAFGVDCAKNEGVGIVDSSFLGNTWVGCHVATNDEGCYIADNLNARSVFVGCYSEGGRPESVLESPSIAIGGLHAAGLVGPRIDGDSANLRDFTATGRMQVNRHSLDFSEHFIAHNTHGRGPDGKGPHGRYEAGFVGYSAWKADGSPRPSGAIAFRPSSAKREDQSVIDFYVYDGDGTDAFIKVAHFWGNTDFTPETDNVTQLGWSGDAWRTLYLNHGPLTPAEASLHTDVAMLTASELAVASALKGLVRKFKRSADTDGILHVGVIAEDVIAAFAAQGLNAFDYGVIEGGQRYHVRYEELLAFIIAAL